MTPSTERHHSSLLGTSHSRPSSVTYSYANSLTYCSMQALSHNSFPVIPEKRPEFHGEFSSRCIWFVAAAKVVQINCSIGTLHDRGGANAIDDKDTPRCQRDISVVESDSLSCAPCSQVPMLTMQHRVRASIVRLGFIYIACSLGTFHKTIASPLSSVNSPLTLTSSQALFKFNTTSGYL